MWAIILTFIAIDGLKYGGIAAVVLIIFRIVMCLMAMFSGIMSGDGFVVKKDKVILRRIDFLDLFHEWLPKVTVTTVGDNVVAPQATTVVAHDASAKTDTAAEQDPSSDGEEEKAATE